MAESIFSTHLERRDFIKYLALSGAGMAGWNMLSGCAVNPVTGERQLMMVSKDQEIRIDRQQSPHQFSADYGVSSDQALNTYIDGVGKRLVPAVHRRDMPYSFRCVNAVYVNAYAFPGGSIALTRGIMLKLDNEAELASLLGHELGHVNARHTAEQMSKSTVSSLLVGGVSAALSTGDSGLEGLARQLGMVGRQMLLAHYSRDNERQADALGNEYLVKGGYSTDGFTGLMEMLNSLHKAESSAASVLFATHPMGSERYRDAKERAAGMYKTSKNLPLNRDRYMDATAGIRAKKASIEELQKAEAFMRKKAYDKAEKHYRQALKGLETDYAANLMTAKCLFVQKKYDQAAGFCKNAVEIDPKEGQARYVSGLLYLNMKKYPDAFRQFEKYDAILGANPQVTFFKGYCLEEMGSREKAAEQYKVYLNSVQQGKYAVHAYKRLKEWGYL
ncbi:MAG: M48 family metalloprotease [Desulfarculaceae bacterium]|nr:M48 family metalloprotease [Desulfarculaceae bacterium]